MSKFSRSEPGHRIPPPRMTTHARGRAQSRAIRDSGIRAALDYGRLIYTRGAEIYALGRKEVERYALDGLDLSAYEGLQVVCALDGSVMTVYRNRNFRGVRTGLGRGRRNRFRIRHGQTHCR